MARQGYRCYQCDEERCNNGTLTEALAICENAVYCWKSTFRADNGTERNSRGCIAKLEHAPLVCSDFTQTQLRTECCAGDFCNNGTFAVLEPHRGVSSTDIMLLVLAQVFTLFFILGIALYYRWQQKVRYEEYLEKQQQQQQATKEKSNLANKIPDDAAPSAPELTIIGVGDSTLKEYLDANRTNTSYFTSPQRKKKRTLYHQITLVERLNRGTFGDHPEVWRGIWLGVKNVAVKIYPSKAEPTWTHEIKIYNKSLFQHENLLNYVGNDITSVAGCTQMWLVTDYQSNGSLRNYLKRTSLGQNEMLRIAAGLACGLLYLHKEVHGMRSKLSIAHRNLSSKNAFVKGNGECVIGGFEVAVTEEEIGKVEFLEYVDKRYVSPELLDPEKTWNINDFRQADIYSLGLILWELCRRCVYDEDDIALDYMIPFSDFLVIGDEEATIENMRKLIVNHSHRPEIPEQWETDPIMSRMAVVMRECWKTKAAARMQVMQVKMMVRELADNVYV